MPLYSVELAGLEEPLPHVPLLKHRNVGPVEKLSRLDGQGKHPLERGQLAIDLGVRDSVPLSLVDEASNRGNTKPRDRIYERGWRGRQAG